MLEILHKSCLLYTSDIQVGEIPADLQDQAQEYHDKLVEQCAELDEDLMEKLDVYKRQASGRTTSYYRSSCNRNWY